jgi:hypothetical protein
MRTSPRKAAWIALGVAGGAVVVLGLAQLLLPRLAAQRVRSQIGRYGVVRSASVSAFPAIELLWGDAQSVTVSAANLDMTPAQANELLWKSRGVQRVDMYAESMRVGSFTLRDAGWRKRGDQLTMGGQLTEADLRSSLPGSTGFTLLGRSSDGVSMCSSAPSKASSSPSPRGFPLRGSSKSRCSQRRTCTCSPSISPKLPRRVWGRAPICPIG